MSLNECAIEALITFEENFPGKKQYKKWGNTINLEFFSFRKEVIRWESNKWQGKDH